MVHLSQPLLLLSSLVPSIAGLYAGIPEVRSSRIAQPTAIRHSPHGPTKLFAPGWRYEMLDLVNRVRAQYRLASLTLDDRLNYEAQRHSSYQYSVQTMTHYDPAGSLADRMVMTGIRWTFVGENVAWNQKSPREVMDAWVRSPHHLANILSDVNIVGFGEQGLYWTQSFAKAY